MLSTIERNERAWRWFGWFVFGLFVLGIVGQILVSVNWGVIGYGVKIGVGAVLVFAWAVLTSKIVLILGILFILYWVIRKAVSDGISN